MINTLGIIGTGSVGGAVARRAVAIGLNVVVSNSRGPETLERLVAELGGQARAATPAEAARAGDIVVASVPLSVYDQLPQAELAGKIVIDTANYAPNDDWSSPELDRDELTSSQLVQRHLVGARVVKALNSFGPQHLESLVRPAGDPGRTALPVAGDDAGAKRRVTDLLEAFGYDVVDTGGLAESWRIEPNSPAYAGAYLPPIPEGLDFDGLMAWVAQAPGVPVSADKLRGLVASAVRGPAGFRL
jgi:8-hydroxy-5-deazaflavin:NADPH oxidoreductase